MHKFTVSDVIADGFDLNQLYPSNHDVVAICNKIDKIRARLSASPTKKWVTEDDVLAECSFLTDQYYLSMIFSESFMSSVSASVTGSQRYKSWYLFRKISTWITRNNNIAPIAVFHSSTHETIKNDIIFNYLIDYNFILQSIKNKKILTLPATSQESVLESCDPEDAKVFTDSSFDKIRLLAYKKIGPISNLDVMIKDPHALIRRYAVRLLSPGDPRLASFINDRSKDVFVQALQKISLSLLPMMIGSNHLKKKHVKEILNQRILAAQG
jgi:hypothetical protein